MRGSDTNAGPMFVYVTTEHFVPKKHPLRTLKPLVDAALSKLDREFDALYSLSGRPSVPPEYLLRGLVLQFLYSIRSFLNPAITLAQPKNSSIFFRSLILCW